MAAFDVLYFGADSSTSIELFLRRSVQLQQLLSSQSPNIRSEGSDFVYSWRNPLLNNITKPTCPPAGKSAPETKTQHSKA